MSIFKKFSFALPAEKTSEFVSVSVCVYLQVQLCVLRVNLANLHVAFIYERWYVLVVYICWRDPSIALPFHCKKFREEMDGSRRQLDIERWVYCKCDMKIEYVR